MKVAAWILGKIRFIDRARLMVDSEDRQCVCGGGGGAGGHVGHTFPLNSLWWAEASSCGTGSARHLKLSARNAG